MGESNVLSDFRLATITPELLARKNEDLAAMGLPLQRCRGGRPFMCSDRVLVRIGSPESQMVVLAQYNFMTCEWVALDSSSFTLPSSSVLEWYPLPPQGTGTMPKPGTDHA